MPMPENSSQNPPAPSLEARVSVVEAELKHLATKADLAKGLSDLRRDLSKEIRAVLFTLLAAMGIMMATLVNLITTYAPPEPPPPPPPALEAPSP